MLTAHEEWLVDSVQEVEQDFYAPLMALCLSRYHQLIKAGWTELDFKDLVLGVYADLNARHEEET